MIQKPDIFDYNDFIKYLKDYYDYRHSIDKKFTKSFICRELGLPNTRSYFHDILSGKFLSGIKVPLFIKLLELSKDGAQFFRALVNFNQATTDWDEHEQLFNQLISLNRTPKKIISKKEYSYYKEWYHSVVRAVLNIVDFKPSDSYKKITDIIVPNITETQIKESIHLLIELGLITVDEDELLRPTD